MIWIMLTLFLLLPSCAQGQEITRVDAEMEVIPADTIPGDISHTIVKRWRPWETWIDTGVVEYILSWPQLGFTSERMKEGAQYLFGAAHVDTNFNMSGVSPLLVLIPTLDSIIVVQPDTLAPPNPKGFNIKSLTESN